MELKEGSKFDSCEEFKNTLKSFCTKHHVVLCVSQSERIEIANKSLKENAKLYDGPFIYRYIRYKCKHGRSIRSTGKVIRPHQR